MLIAITPTVSAWMYPPFDLDGLLIWIATWFEGAKLFSVGHRLQQVNTIVLYTPLLTRLGRFDGMWFFFQNLLEHFASHTRAIAQCDVRLGSIGGTVQDEHVLSFDS